MTSGIVCSCREQLPIMLDISKYASRVNQNKETVPTFLRNGVHCSSSEDHLTTASSLQR